MKIITKCWVLTYLLDDWVILKPLLDFRFDPSLIYGQTQTYKAPNFKPHFILYDKKCLTFRAFFKQSVPESPDEHYRVRQVNIIYFLEDDSITVMEPPVQVKCKTLTNLGFTFHISFWHLLDIFITGWIDQMDCVKIEKLFT